MWQHAVRAVPRWAWTAVGSVVVIAGLWLAHRRAVQTAAAEARSVILTESADSLRVLRAEARALERQAAHDSAALAVATATADSLRARRPRALRDTLWSTVTVVVPDTMARVKLADIWPEGDSAVYVAHRGDTAVVVPLPTWTHARETIAAGDAVQRTSAQRVATLDSLLGLTRAQLAQQAQQVVAVRRPSRAKWVVGMVAAGAAGYGIAQAVR